MSLTTSRQSSHFIENANISKQISIFKKDSLGLFFQDIRI